MPECIYFDHSATTPMDPRVADAMRPYLGGLVGNPSSLHRPGREARQAVERARAEVAALLHAEPEEIIFTASGTESDNMALTGIASRYAPHDCHLITSAIEHPAILETCRHLQRGGYGVDYLPITGDGLVRSESLAGAIRPTTRIVSVMTAQNVVGTLQPIAELGRVARERGMVFHTDAVQAAGKIPLHMDRLGVDLLSLSAHKLHGPKGVGALYVRRGTEIEPLVRGGGQERGLRSATEDVAGIVGFGAAAAIARLEMAEEAARLVRLRDRLIAELATRIPNAYLIGDRYRRLPGHLCLGFEGQEGESIRLLLALDEEGVAISSGSACSAHHAGQPSYILTAMGMDSIRARGSLRITLGRFNTTGEVERFLEILPRVVSELRPVTSRRFAPAEAE